MRVAVFAAAAAAIVAYFASTAGTIGLGAQNAIIRAASKQDSVRLLIDGRVVGPLPQEVRDVTPGMHVIVFQGNDRYATERREVTIAANETLDLGSITLSPIKARASFDVRSPGVSLMLSSGDRQIPVADPSRPTELEMDRDWTLEAKRAGFRDVRMPLGFDGKPGKTFAVSVDDPVQVPATQAAAKAQAPATPATPATPQTTSQTTSQPSSAATPGPKTLTISTPPPEGAAASGGPCTFNFNSIPVSKVLLDGRPLGDTPKIGVTVAAGKHNIAFIGESGKKATTAECRGGEKKTVAVRLK